MRTLIASFALLWATATVSAQTELPADSLRGISMENYKVFKGGFLLDMGMMIAAPPPLLPPQADFDFRSLGTTRDYNRLFRLKPAVAYGRESAAFKLKNGLRIHTYGEYDADGNKVRRPGALPWERNNFKGAFEVKSANGNFGFRLEVRQEKAPY